jgi:hypothetical protein
LNSGGEFKSVALSFAGVNNTRLLKSRLLANWLILVRTIVSLSFSGELAAFVQNPIEKLRVNLLAFLALSSERSALGTLSRL